LEEAMTLRLGDFSQEEDRMALLDLVTDDLENLAYENVNSLDVSTVHAAGQHLELGRERNESADNAWYLNERPVPMTESFSSGEPLTNFEDVWRRERNFGSGPLNARPIHRIDSTSFGKNDWRQEHVVASGPVGRCGVEHRLGDSNMEIRSSLVGVTTKTLENFGVVWRRFAYFVGTSYVLGGPMIAKKFFTDENISEFILHVGKDRGYSPAVKKSTCSAMNRALEIWGLENIFVFKFKYPLTQLVLKVTIPSLTQLFVFNLNLIIFFSEFRTGFCI
jgi:hypothetical protein